MTTADALPEDMPGLRAAALALLAERDELLRRVDRMHHIIRQFQRAQFGRHSEKLDPDQRAAVVLRDIEQMNYTEIAETLDTEIGTVKSRIARGRRNLREILEAAIQ